MNEFENKLQEDVEQGKGGLSADTVAYKIVFSALKKDAPPALPSNFADRVVQRSLSHTGTTRYMMEYLWLAAGCFALLICLLIALAYISIPAMPDVIKPMLQYSGLFLTVALFVAAFHIVDKRLLARNDFAS